MMSSDEMPPARMEAGGEGVGEIDGDQVARRAAELASIEGRTEPGEKDFADARADLANPGASRAAPEEMAGAPSGGIAAGSEFEELAVDPGRGAGTPFAREKGTGALLVEEGVEEADHDLRVQSAEEQNREADEGEE